MTRGTVEEARAPNLSLIRRLVREQFAQAQRGPTGFDCFHRTLLEYRHWLPTYETAEGPLDFLAVVGQAVERKGRASVLDIGCGAGYALAELVARFGERVAAYGLTAYDYRPVTPIEEEKAELYRLAHYLVADAHDLLRLEALRGLAFDCALLVESLRFFADPLRVLKAAYRLLASDGFLFLTPWRARVQRPGGGGLLSGSEWAALLRDLGYDVQAQARCTDPNEEGLVMRKTLPRLRLPVRYACVRDGRLVYSLKD